jgi:hypothetical protein
MRKAWTACEALAFGRAGEIRNEWRTYDWTVISPIMADCTWRKGICPRVGIRWLERIRFERWRPWEGIFRGIDIGKGVGLLRLFFEVATWMRRLFALSLTDVFLEFYCMEGRWLRLFPEATDNLMRIHFKVWSKLVIFFEIRLQLRCGFFVDDDIFFGIAFYLRCIFGVHNDVINLRNLMWENRLIFWFDSLIFILPRLFVR